MLDTNKNLPATTSECDQILASTSSDYGSITINTFVFPLSTVESAKQLEVALSDAKFRKELKTRIFKNIGKNDGEVGGQYMNKLGNQIFTDQLLQQYTFKGISRGGVKKECFAALRNVMMFLQNMLCEVNSTFDMKRTEKYVQSKLLRHSGSRIKRS